MVNRRMLTAVGQSLRGTSRHCVGRPGHAMLASRCHRMCWRADLIVFTRGAQAGSNLVRKVSWDSEPGLAVNSAYKITGTSDFISCRFFKLGSIQPREILVTSVITH